MYHRNYTTYLQKELDFLKLLVTRFHEQEKVNGLELDIALLKTQEIYEQLLRIKSMPEAGTDEKKAAPIPEEVPPVAVIEKKIPEPVHQPEPPKEQFKPQPQPAHTAPKPAPKTVAVEIEITAPPVEAPAPEKVVVAKEEPVTKEEPAPVRNEKKQPPATESAKTGILAEKIGPTDFHPINETLAQQKPGSDLSSKLQTAPLSSIVSGIGLNDKFLYMRELFKGDNALYSNTIRHLDTAESLGDAMDFINRHFDWDKKDETVQKFINLVQRRHGN